LKHRMCAAKPGLALRAPLVTDDFDREDPRIVILPSNLNLLR